MHFSALIRGLQREARALFAPQLESRRWRRAFNGVGANDERFSGSRSFVRRSPVTDLGVAPRDGVGTVFLVGAGPGDPDLLTVRAARVLQEADVVFYDELVTSGILASVRADAECIAVGKRRGHPGVGQAEINRLLVDAARGGRVVVRLKGGDPFVFGRGGEELEYLRAAGVPAVVVPGVTAALGCAAEVGLPLTFRNEATRLMLVTAHHADGAAATDWSGLGDPSTTVAIYMGRDAAAAVRDGLIGAGRDPATPAAVLARGTRPNARSVVGRLDELSRLAALAGAGPALLVIGQVVARSDAWRARESAGAVVGGAAA